jgi:hypothetical protein
MTDQDERDIFDTIWPSKETKEGINDILEVFSIPSPVQNMIVKYSEIGIDKNAIKLLENYTFRASKYCYENTTPARFINYKDSSESIEKLIRMIMDKRIISSDVYTLILWSNGDQTIRCSPKFTLDKIINMANDLSRRTYPYDSSFNIKFTNPDIARIHEDNRDNETCCLIIDVAILAHI